VNQDQAFPATQINICDGQVNSCVIYPGLTKREYFAAIAMQAFVSNPSVDLADNEIVTCAVCLADTLIAELNK
jgi:hypothetical protein